MATPYAMKLAALAEQEFTKYSGIDETTAPMSTRIKSYWTGLGMAFPGVSTPWSAVFVSFMVKQAGASGAEFLFAASHSQFVYKAIQDFKAGVGVFHGRDPKTYAPKIGDIIQNNRTSAGYNYAFASANKTYKSHSAIVVEEGVDGSGRYVRTVGGNESDSVDDKIIRLNNSGLIKPPAAAPNRFICIIQTLK